MTTRTTHTHGDRIRLVLADAYLARHTSPFEAYMALQCALLARFIRRGGTSAEWCDRLAPAFRRRYAPILLRHLLN
jgi:hypothetical protein